MELLITREPSSDGCTMGMLFINGVFECFTLERPEAGDGPLSIPVGRYKVVITPSFRFKRMLPVVVGVPGRTGIRFHPGNEADDSSGCVLLGTSQAANRIGNSRAACELFQAKLAKVLAVGENVWLTITHAPAEARKA